MKNPVRTGTIIALAAGSLFAAACSKGMDSKSTMPAGGEKTASAVHCAGINACKGQGSCKSAKNACKGQNSCKGEGMLNTANAEDCTSQGGSVMTAP